MTITNWGAGIAAVAVICAGTNVFAAPSSAASANSGQEGRAKPNIVHILVDDLGWQDVASHKVDGKPVYETPNLDRLTKEGRRFTQAYSPAPSCSPSRAAFLRGRYPVHTGVYHVIAELADTSFPIFVGLPSEYIRNADGVTPA